MRKPQYFGKSMMRAVRRYRMERAKIRVRRLYSGWARGSDRVTGLLANTRVPCSCPGCGNPRRHFGQRTRQEIIALTTDTMEAA